MLRHLGYCWGPRLSEYLDHGQEKELRRKEWDVYLFESNLGSSPADSQSGDTRMMSTLEFLLGDL